MEKEQYVSLETSQLLTEKGFDWDTDKVYERNIMACRYEDYPMPTQATACRWLREEKGIHILPEISEVKENPKYYCMIWNTTNLESFIVDLFGSYEDAVEAALQYALKNIIK